MSEPTREEVEEMRHHLEILAKGMGILLRCHKQGIEPDRLFMETMEEATAKAGAFLLTTERGPDRSPEGHAEEEEG